MRRRARRGRNRCGKRHGLGQERVASGFGNLEREFYAPFEYPLGFRLVESRQNSRELEE
jgi:hypothetical protein